MSYLFKLFLVCEIKRQALEQTCKEYYTNISVLELTLQFGCSDATLTRGSLPLVEKFLINKAYDREYIDKKLEDMENHHFYLDAKEIYDFFIALYPNPKELSNEEYFGKIKELGMNGEFDRVVLRRRNQYSKKIKSKGVNKNE